MSGRLHRVGDAVELDLAFHRPDGQLCPYTTMCDIYLRSAEGPDRPWYRYARASGTGPHARPATIRPVRSRS